MADQPLSQELERILQLQQDRDYDEALALGAQLQAAYPQSHLVHKQLAHVHDAMKNFQAAIDEISRAIALVPDEPDFYFNRARWYIETQLNDEAIADCDMAIKIENALGRSYYRGSTYLVRAFAKLQTGDYLGALEDSEQSPKPRGLLIQKG